MREQESQLTNVPSKVFYQGEWGEVEKPIIINYYNGCIGLDQQDNTEVLINDDNLEQFIKSLRKGFKQAKSLRI